MAATEIEGITWIGRTIKMSKLSVLHRKRVSLQGKEPPGYPTITVLVEVHPLERGMVCDQPKLPTSQVINHRLYLLEMSFPVHAVNYDVIQSLQNRMEPSGLDINTIGLDQALCDSSMTPKSNIAITSRETASRRASGIRNRRIISSDLQKERQMEAGVKCTARTVRNRLLEAGLKSCKPRKKPFINEKQRRARLKFAIDHKDWTIEDWSKVIFSDGSNFQLCPTPVHLMVRQSPGEAYKPQCLAPTMKFGGGSVMIWGCFSKAGIGQGNLCEGCMNQATCKVILEKRLIPSAQPWDRKLPLAMERSQERGEERQRRRTLLATRFHPVLFILSF
ncbi:unnamed protein product [Ranitomeya imitator]|uniref:Transposase Tc1-like domain-containing protein n=1 Tax=Ranitomeya imitator TaxID=111125 RepID=A0ABN9KSD7_9NEOB|nr:unnamed protein product [Ranitomeya imitator]